MIRVTAGTPVAAVHKLYDNATTSVEALNLTAKQKEAMKLQLLLEQMYLAEAT